MSRRKRQPKKRPSRIERLRARARNADPSQVIVCDGCGEHWIERDVYSPDVSTTPCPACEHESGMMLA